MTEGIILYGVHTLAVAEALRELDPRYGAEVPVLCCRDGPEADAARAAAPDVDWLVAALYGTFADLEKAAETELWLNMNLLAPGRAASAIDQRELEAWYEIVKPVRVVTVDGGPVEDDYSNLKIIVPEGNRRIAHAVPLGGTWPPCANREAEMLMPTSDLWVLAEPVSPQTVPCPACVARHRR
ncbi:MAG TPA: hypothetical protein VN408_34950 [Actinoplanes sp.]|nr:hypothetical protein [Actinoplanes sp.]